MNLKANLFLAGKRKLWVEIAMEHYEFEFDDFNKWLKDNQIRRSEIIDDHIADYFEYLRLYGPYDDLLEKMSEEIFFILFLNRQTLQRFNQLISHQIQDKKIDELDEDDLPFFKKDGVLKRVSIPKWVLRAVIHRDRGMCINCHKDLTGLISVASTSNFDHIVPLATGGINDVTNIQLLCENCNKTKKAQNIPTSIKYERWY